jgi:hypothetical protein
MHNILRLLGGLGLSGIAHGGALPVFEETRFLAGNPQDYAELGMAVSAGGDLNSDGYDDLVASAVEHTNDSGSTGALFVWYGSADGINKAKEVVPSDGDTTGFGRVLEIVGDVNADGYDDLLVGDSQRVGASGQNGMVYLFPGSSTGLDAKSMTTAEVPLGTPGWCYACGLAGAGDIDGDGDVEVIVGAQTQLDGSRERGALYLYTGESDGLSAEPQTILSPDLTFDAHFAGDAASAGDINGDGYDDVLVNDYIGAKKTDGGGVVWILPGSIDGLVSDDATRIDGEGRLFGYTVNSAGDIDGDSFDDVVITDPGEQSLHLYSGSASGLLTGTPTVLTAPDFREVSQGRGVGDLDGDGQNDLLCTSNFPGQTRRGGISLILDISGGGTWIDLLPSGAKDGDELGQSGTSAADFNGDGKRDVVSGAPGVKDTNREQGAVYVFLQGAPDTTTDTASPDTATPDTATPDTATPDTATPDTSEDTDSTDTDAETDTLPDEQGCRCSSGGAGAGGLLSILVLLVTLRTFSLREPHRAS